MVMELTALNSTKDLLGASYGKTKLAGDTSSSTFSDLLPKDRQAADRRDSIKSGAADNNRPAPERDRAPKTEAIKPDSHDGAREEVAGTRENKAARQNDAAKNRNEQQGATETPKPGQADQPHIESEADRPHTESERVDAVPHREEPNNDPARPAAEAAKTGSGNAQSHKPVSPVPSAAVNPEGNGAPRPGTAAALIASLAGTPAEPAAPSPGNQTAPVAPAPVSGSPDGAVISPNIQIETAGRAAAAYAAIQPQPPAPTNPTVATAAAAAPQPGTPATPQPVIAPAQAATATPDVAPPAPATPTPTPATTGQPAITTPNTPATTPPTPIASEPQPALPPTPVASKTPSAPPSEQSTAQIIDTLVRAGGESGRRPRAGLVPGRSPASGPATPGPRTTTARSGTPQSGASPVAAQPLVAVPTSSATQSQPPVTMAAATVAPIQASEGHAGPVTDSGRLTVETGRPTIALPDQAAGTVIKTAESHAAAATRTTRSATPVPVSEQVSVRIQKAVATGADRIEVHLKPASLGRVNVALEFAHDGRVLAVVTADSPDTLDMLKQDSRSLERALQDAGLKTDSGSLSFNLRGNGQDSAKAGSSGGDGHVDVSDETGEDAEPAETPARMIAGSGLLDIHV